LGELIVAELQEAFANSFAHFEKGGERPA